VCSSDLIFNLFLALLRLFDVGAQDE